MKYLNLFESFLPNDEESDKVYKYVNSKYLIGKNEMGKYVLVDEKTIYISGHFSSKKRAIDKIYNQIKDIFTEYNESSIRLGIRKFINENI